MTEQELREKANLALNEMFFTKHRKRLGIPWLFANAVDGLADDCIEIILALVKEAKL